ncbi:MAG: segregation ATPase FtsK/SpoIIIE, family, partial [Patescibacteria group bacterium]|nr:segregation ATPase FtsK/SpoIIIE, family [Patescibacteria group bacterium]
FYIAKILGLFIVLVGITGFSHWFYESDKMLKMASSGHGGGYLGYIAAYAATKYLGNAGGLVTILAVFFIGAIMAFDFSIMSVADKFKKKETENEEDAEGEKSDELPPEEAPNSGEASGGAKEIFEDPKNNIKKVEFVEGPDQFVSGDLDKDSGESGIVRRSLTVGRNSQKYLSKKKTASEEKSWEFPPLDLLEKSSGSAKGGDTNKNAEIVEKTLRNFGIEVERGDILTGPSVTQYSFRPAVGVKISKILGLQNDLALALAAHPIRIEAPIPGKSLIGIEVPNKVSATVRLRDILESSDFRSRESDLNLALGEDVSGQFIFGNLEKMPHLLIAGATGTGKSVSINSIITTLLYQNSPEELKFIMVDPKRVELSLYNGIPHLLTDVIVENGKVVSALRWAVSEMEKRYRMLQDTGSRDILSYKEKQKAGKKIKYTDPETKKTEEREMENLPYIVIVIDELADLMGSHGKEVEGAIVRIAQMARAVGIHLILSTQRPSVEVITGLIKANVTTRVAFQVATQIDSRTILDMAGAEKLLGNGDLLYLSASSPKPKRIQGVFVSESEVKRVVKFIKDQKEKRGEDEIGENIVENVQRDVFEFKNADQEVGEDDMYEAAKAEVIRSKKASASLLQRRLRVGYARAARLLDILEERGIIGPADGAKPREVFSAAEDVVNYENPVGDQQERDKWQI